MHSTRPEGNDDRASHSIPSLFCVSPSSLSKRILERLKDRFFLCSKRSAPKATCLTQAPTLKYIWHLGGRENPTGRITSVFIGPIHHRLLDQYSLFFPHPLDSVRWRWCLGHALVRWCLGHALVQHHLQKLKWSFIYVSTNLYSVQNILKLCRLRLKTDNIVSYGLQMWQFIFVVWI